VRGLTGEILARLALSNQPTALPAQTGS
jgi:hypothetical protein